MRRVVLIGVAVGAAIVAGLTVTSRVHAQTTGNEALTICSDGQGHISVSGSGFSPDLNSEAPNVWVGNIEFTDDAHTQIIGDDSASLVVDQAGTFTSSLPAADLPASSLGTPAGTVAVATGDYQLIYGPIVVSSIDSCSTTGGGPIATSVVVSGSPPSSPAAQPRIVLHGALADASGSPVLTAGVTITFTASDGTTATCTTDATGTCSATLPLTSPAEHFDANIPGGTGTFGGSLQLTGSLSPAPSAAQTTISASPGSIAADGTSQSTITVQTRDQFGFNETSSAGTVALATNRGSLSQVTDNHNGTYTATLTSSTAFGPATVTGTLNGSPIGGPGTLFFNQVASTTLSAFGTPTPGTIAADGTSTSTITLQVKDLAGGNFAGNAGIVTVSTTLGSFAGGCTTNCPAQFTGNGGYSATLVAGVNGGTATITGAINNASMAQSTTVTLMPVASAANSVISSPTASVPADGTTTTTVTVQIKDLGGSNFRSGGGSVVLSTTLGTLGAVIDNGDGTYTATILSSTAGTATVTAMFNGSPIPGSAAVTFTPWVSALGCPTALGDVHGGLEVKGGIKINVEADCDPADKKHPTSYLHHAKLHVEGLGVKFDAKRDDDGKKGDITSVALTRSGDGSATAVFNGTYNGQPFTLTVTDGGKKKGAQDSFTFTYGGRVYGPYLTPHGNVKIDLE